MARRAGLRRCCVPQQADDQHSDPAAACSFSDLNGTAVLQLYQRGLVWLEVPVRPEDHLSIPPLEGFVSNKTQTAAAADPTETLLYQVRALCMLCCACCVCWARMHAATAAAVRRRHRHPQAHDPCLLGPPALCRSSWPHRTA